jgi:hypothetical protein
MGDLAIWAQFGFAALAAGALWLFIQRLVPQLLTIIEQNSQALTKTAEALAQVVAGQKDMQMRLGRMDDRLMLLEKQHEGAIRECPYTGQKEE